MCGAAGPLGRDGVSCGPQVAHLFCGACEQALCEDCVPGHEEHPRLTLDQGLEQQRGRLQDKLASVQDR